MSARKIDWLRLLPGFWLQNEPTDWEWDATLNRLLDKHEPKEGYLTASIGGVEVWTGNYPYSYGSCHDPKLRFLPSVATRKRLRAVLEKAERARIFDAIAKAEAR